MSALAALQALPAADPIKQGRAAMAAKDFAAAAARFHAAAAASPADYEARYWLYSALAAAGESGAAAGVLDEARNLHAHAVIQATGADMQRFRDDKAYCAHLGRQLYGAKLMAAASVCLGRALDFDNLDASLMVSYGLSLQHQGRITEAVDVFNAASSVFTSAAVHEFLLFPLFFVEDRQRRACEEARRWAALYAEPFTPVSPVFANSRKSGRALRVGYVGPSFTRVQVAQFIGPVLAAHDPGRVKVYLYGADPSAEGPLPGHCTVRNIGGLSDEAAAALVRQDRIDILVDLWGHAAGSRLMVFAHRPAPIQVAWINFVQTTGMSSIDYVLHAETMKTPDAQAYFHEAIVDMGPVMAPFAPPPGRPDVAPTPALRNGYVTYGSFNNPVKLSDETVAAWAAILAARPADRLVLKYSYFEDPVLQRVTRARFAASGADPEQLEFRGHSLGADYLRQFQDIDLALDPSPCPGGTTSCDAMANGVPVLTLDGEDFYAKIGLPVVLPCGFPELVAADWDDYVARALALTADPEALDALRRRVRPGFEASPYMDADGFTRRLEAAFRDMYDRWRIQEG